MSLADFRRKIQQLKASIPILQLIENDGHKVFRSGGLMKICCPFHREKTPSFVVYDDHVHCFGCSFHGDIFHYVMQRDGCDFVSAVERLSGGSVRKNHIIHRVSIRPKEPELPKDYFQMMMEDWCDRTVESGDTKLVRSLSKSLGVDYNSLLSVTCVVTPDRNFAFPMCDGDKKVIGIRLRDNNGKKWAVKGSKQGLFIPCDTPQKDLYVTEGPTDCAAMLSMGLFSIGKAAAMQGPEEIVKFVTKNRIRRVIVIADNDDAGLRGATKLIDVCPVPCCELVLPAKDAREFYRNGGTKTMIEAMVKNCVWRQPKNAQLHP